MFQEDTTGISHEDFAVGDPLSSRDSMHVRDVSQQQTFNDSVNAPAFAIPSVVAGMIDTFGQSFGLLDDKDTVNFLKKYAPSLGAFYDESEEGIKFASDIIGSFIPATVGARAVRTGSSFHKMARKTLGTRTDPFFSTGLSNQKLWERYHEELATLAKTGTRAVDKFPEFTKLRRRAIGRSVADTALEAVAADVAVAATMSQSEVIFPTDFSLMEHLIFFGGVNTAITAGAGAIAKFSFNRHVQEIMGPMLKAEQNVAGLPVVDAFTRMVGHRGPAITVFNRGRQSAQERGIKALEEGDQAKAAELNNERVAYEKAAKEQFQAAARDNPIEGITKRHQLSNEEANTMLATGKKDPDSAFDLVSLQGFQKGAADAADEAINERLLTKKAELSEWQDEARKLLTIAEEAGPGRRKTMAKRAKRMQDRLTKLQAEIDETASLTSVVYEIDGTVSTATGRGELFQDGGRSIANLAKGETQTTVGNLAFKANQAGDTKIPANAPLSPRFIKSLEKEVQQLKALEIDPLQLSKEVGAKSPTDLAKRLNAAGRAGLKDSPQLMRIRRLFEGQDTVVVYAKDLTNSEVALKRTTTYNTPVVISVDDIWGLSGSRHLLADMPFSHAGKFEPRMALSPMSFASLTLKDRTAVMDTLQKAREGIDPPVWEGTELHQAMHWTKVDHLAMLVKEQGDIVESKIRGFTSLEDLEFRALQSKAVEYQMLRQEANAALEKGEFHWAQNLEDLARGLNMPLPPHPVYRVLETLMPTGKNQEPRPLTSRVKNMDELKTALKEEMGEDIREEMSAAFSITGPMMRLPRDRKPVIGVMRNTASSDVAISKDDLVSAATSVRSQFLHNLETQGGRLTKDILQVYRENPAMLESIKQGLPEVVQGLQHSGLVASQLVQQSFRLRGTPGFPALNLFTDLTDKATKTFMSDMMTEKLPQLGGRSIREAFNTLLEPQNSPDLISFNILDNAFGAGWKIKSVKPVDVNVGSRVEGQFQYILENDAQNRAIWRRLFGEQMPEDDEILLPVSSAKETPLTVTELAHSNMLAFNHMSQRLLTEVNGQRAAMGMRALPRKAFHLPPKNLSGTHVTYLLDNSGQVRAAVSAGTPQASRRLAEQEIANSQIPLNMVDETVVARYSETRGRAFFELSDYSNPRKQTGPAKGTSFGVTIERGRSRFREMNETLLKQFNDAGREARMAILDPELQFLRRQSMASGTNRRKEPSVYDLMVNTMLGTQNLTTASIPGRALLATETMYDQLMQRVFDKLPSSAGGGILGTKMAQAEYEAFLDRSAPEFNPFSSFNDYLEKTAKIKVPGQLRKHAGVLNEITTAMAIRVFDIGMGVINTLSLASTLPPVAKMLQRLPNETKEKHLERIAAFGASSDKGLAYFSPTRAVISGVHFMFSKEGQQIARRAKEKGFFEQYAAEQVEIFAKSGESFIGGLLRSFADKTSFITDKTEIGARAFSWMTFYNVGKKGLNLDDNAAMAFAHAQANNVIADFRPSNRPVIFQGAAGMPLGLFTTFMWNYLQRLYSLVESANIGGLINQVGLQSALFGAESVPGVPEFLSIVGSNYDGSENLVDRLHRAYGQDITSAILNGSISSLSGVSIGPRAAVGLPFQSGVSAQAVAGFRMAGRAVSTAHQIAQHTIDNSGFSPGHAAEVVARSNLNKGVSNAIEYVQGHSTDVAGNLIERDTRTAIGLGARLAGMKPLFADELRQENVRNRSTDRIRQGLKRRLGHRLQSAIRRGELSSEVVESALEDYLRAGGNSENFKRFYAGQVMKATQSKSHLEIAKALRNSNDDSRLARLLFLSGE